MFIFNFFNELMDVDEYLIFCKVINILLKYLFLEVIIVIINFKIRDIIQVLLFHNDYMTKMNIKS